MTQQVMEVWSLLPQKFMEKHSIFRFEMELDKFMDSKISSN